MEPLTFNFCGEVPCDNDLSLTPCSPFDISETMWEELAASFAGEGTLISCPAALLSQRCYEGYAAVMICGGHIISYTSLVPVVRRAPGVHSWMEIMADLAVNPAALPGIDVYKFTSTWTHPAWRRKRISLALHLPLVERFLQSDNLGLAGMIGLTSPILAQLGWHILAWDAAPFVNSLVAVPVRDFPAQAALGLRTPEWMKPYQGPHIPLDDPTHPWDQFFYCWASSMDVAMHLERELAALTHADLGCWRSMVVTAFARPESTHGIIFLS